MATTATTAAVVTVNGQTVDTSMIDPRLVAMVNNMKVGMNVLPGIGAGYASDEADLERMKQFVLGTLAAAAAHSQVDREDETSIEEPEFIPDVEDAEYEEVE